MTYNVLMGDDKPYSLTHSLTEGLGILPVKKILVSLQSPEVCFVDPA